MSKKSVFCIATSRSNADQIVDRLKGAKFSNNDICVTGESSAKKGPGPERQPVPAPALSI